MFVHNIYGAPCGPRTGFINLHISPIVNVYFNIHLFIIPILCVLPAAATHTLEYPMHRCAVPL